MEGRVLRPRQGVQGARFALGEEDLRAQRTLLLGLLRIDAYHQAYTFIRDTCGEAWNREFAAEVERCIAEARSLAA